MFPEGPARGRQGAELQGCVQDPALGRARAWSGRTEKCQSWLLLLQDTLGVSSSPTSQCPGRKVIPIQGSSTSGFLRKSIMVAGEGSQSWQGSQGRCCSVITSLSGPDRHRSSLALLNQVQTPAIGILGPPENRSACFVPNNGLHPPRAPSGVKTSFWRPTRPSVLHKPYI